MAKFILFTGPVRSGKSTALLRWIENGSDCKGFICPDVDGKRMLYSITDQITNPFEVDAGGPEKIIQIGRFSFLQSTFTLARKILQEGCVLQAGTFIIDEVGWMELKGEGFEPELSKFIDAVRHHSQNLNVFMVVRESLIDEVIEHYHLSEVDVIDVRTTSLP